MKVLPFKIPKPDKDAFVFQIDHEELFYDKLHQHEEIQISYIVEGKGTLVAGDSVNYYSAGDIIVIGSHLPHVFKSEEQTSKSLMLTLFFLHDSFGEDFFELPELRELKPFFNRSKYGFKISSSAEEIHSLFHQLKQSTKLNQFIILIQLLQKLVVADSKSLSSFIYNKEFSDIEGKRMRNVFEFTMNHFTEDISLGTISAVANMTKNAFCKYFKKRTNKTYIQFLTDLRLENACKLLKEKENLSISDIAEKSGFSNISNFNRQFKSTLGTTPLNYRKNTP